MNKSYQDIIHMYTCLGDDLSKEIFSYRLLYYFSNDDRLLKRLVLTTEEGRMFFDMLNATDKKKVIFGAGSWGKAIAKAFPDIKFECFVDNYAKRSSENGIPVISFSEYVENFRDAIIVISSRVRYKEMWEQLLKEGISEENILNAGKINDEFCKRQYFDLPELKQKQNPEGESFVDAGCLDGSSSLFFTKWCEGSYKKIWGFEPDKENAKRCERAFELNGIKNYEVFRKGLWNSDTRLRFSASSNGLSKIMEDGENVIEVAKLDDVISPNEEVTFIKMDIEGAEHDALIGAKRIIEEQKPKLAISIYHKPEDILDISRLVLSFNPNYKLYLRHYSLSEFETVLYAI